MWELEFEESCALKNWCFWTVVLEKTLESPLDCKEIQPVHSEGDQSWVFFIRNDAKPKTPVLWPPHANSWLIGKDSDAGRDWGQEEKGTTEDEMAGWHHRLDGHESKWTPGDGDGQGGLACCYSWGRKELDTTERLNWTELNTFEHWEDIAIPWHEGMKRSDSITGGPRRDGAIENDLPQISSGKINNQHFSSIPSYPAYTSTIHPQLIELNWKPSTTITIITNLTTESTEASFQGYRTGWRKAWRDLGEPWGITSSSALSSL